MVARGTTATVAVDIQPEAVVAGGHGDDLAGVDHADLDPLGGDHDLPALRHPPLNNQRGPALAD
jgi:hypothetical protein